MTSDAVAENLLARIEQAHAAHQEPPPKSDEVAAKRAWHERRARDIDQVVLRLQRLEQLYGADTVHTAIASWQSRPRTRFDEMQEVIAGTVHTLHQMPALKAVEPEQPEP